MSILDAKDTQFTLADDGQIFYQQQESNPTPGEAVAMVKKGVSILKPDIVVFEGESLKALDQNALSEKIKGWIERHIAEVLEPLVNLDKTAECKPSVQSIASNVYDALGIVPRERLEETIQTLDADDRRDLRTLKIRLGPILVFIPALNKPAAVRLRALLWGLWREKDLPMECPKDGIVSFEVDAKTVDKDFYQAIAYPVFGGRAIRIDMLDRVISAVYDAADKGKFKAEHKMAEWLGSSIDGLYEVLAAMGHKKIYDPADEASKEDAADSVEENPKPLDGEVEKDIQPAAPEGAPEKVQANDKPELATFVLKKGKAFQKSAGDKGKRKDKEQGKKKGKRNKSTNRTPKVMSVGPEKKLEDSPFAVLEQLKKQSNEKS